jgi:hypothetical protein
MSKRHRNHHIPRFLLNRFASRVEGDKHWIWQISRDAGAQELSTRDVAVSRGFYGGRADGVEDALVEVESRFAAALACMDDRHPPEAFADGLRQFAWMMAVRTRAIREQFAAAFDMLLAEFGKWSNRVDANSSAGQQLRARLDQEIEKAIQKLPPQARIQAATAIQVPAIRGLLLGYAASNFGVWTGIMIYLVQSQRLIARSAKGRPSEGSGPRAGRWSNLGQLQAGRLAPNLVRYSQFRARRWWRRR